MGEEQGREQESRQLRARAAAGDSGSTRCQVPARARVAFAEPPGLGEPQEPFPHPSPGRFPVPAPGQAGGRG